jgi:EAL domain-containing protein (putative c-di-GMP-specific phosphodiesterase class I)
MTFLPPDAIPVDPGDWNSADEIIQGALRAIRENLDMPIAFLGEFVGGRRIYRQVDSDGCDHPFAPGASHARSETLCGPVVDGQLPEMMADLSAFPLARAIVDAAGFDLGSHVSVPIHRADGSVYGTFCALSPRADPTLNARDLRMMRSFARLVGDQVRHRLAARVAVDDARGRIEAVISRGALTVAYQPIYRLRDGALVSFEALSRIATSPVRPPDLWFADAQRAGLRGRFEMYAVEAALAGFADVSDGQRLSVNAAPETIAAGLLLPVAGALGPGRLTVEMTEHDRIQDVERLDAACAALRAAGCKIAVDDVGAGYAGLQQLVRVPADILKLDMSLVRGIHEDGARRSIVAAMARFGRETGSLVTAEGIERPEEWRTLRELGIDCGQGWLMGRPGPHRSASGRVAVETGAPL